MLQDFLKLILLIAALALVLWLYTAWFGIEHSPPAPVEVKVGTGFH